MVERMSQRNYARGPAWALAFVLVLGASGPEALADTIYRFVDQNGVIHFSNVPTDPRYKKFREDRRPARYAQTVQSKALQQSFARTITEASLRHQLDPALVRAVIKAESSFVPDAVSPKGAVGLMQLMPETATSLNVINPYDPEQNISGGVRHLRYLLDRFRGNVRLAVAAYNAGERRILRDSRIPPITETREYVRRVLRFYKEFSREPEPSLVVTRRFINYLSP
jgi:soluble lytic murein transglycosylase